MKYHHIYRSTVRQPLYPGAADSSYFHKKSLEILTAIVSGTGAITVMLFLVAMA